MNRKAYLRTIEMAIAIILTFTVAYYIFPRASTPAETQNLGILSVLEQKPEFRSCVANLNYNCTESFLRNYTPSNYDFAYDITEDPNQGHSGLPSEAINAESVYMAGDKDLYNPKIVKLYYWRKE